MHNVDRLLSKICWSTDWYLNELFIIINILLFYHMKQIESLLLWVCTVIHNVSFFLSLPHFDVICDLLLNRSMKTWNLFFDLKIFILC